MMEVKVKTKKWGNSIGILIPKEAVRKENIKPDQEVTILVSSKPKTTGRDLFGKWKFKKPTEELMREVDKDFDLGF